MSRRLIVAALTALTLGIAPMESFAQFEQDPGGGGSGSGGCPPQCGCAAAPAGMDLAYSCGCVNGEVQNRVCTYRPL